MLTLDNTYPDQVFWLGQGRCVPPGPRDLRAGAQRQPGLQGDKPPLPERRQCHQFVHQSHRRKTLRGRKIFIWAVMLLLCFIHRVLKFYTYINIVISHLLRLLWNKIAGCLTLRSYINKILYIYLLIKTYFILYYNQGRKLIKNIKLIYKACLMCFFSFLFWLWKTLANFMREISKKVFVVYEVYFTWTLKIWCGIMQEVP